MNAAAERLRIFRFRRGAGGHANEPDVLIARFAYANEAELHAFFAHLGVALVVHAVEPPKPVVGKRYSAAEAAVFVSVIPGTKFLQQPGAIVVDGSKVHARADGARIILEISTDWSVGEADVAAAEVVEKRLTTAPLAVQME